MDAWVLPLRDSDLIGNTQVLLFKKERHSLGVLMCRYG